MLSCRPNRESGKAGAERERKVSGMGKWVAYSKSTRITSSISLRNPIGKVTTVREALP